MATNEQQREALTAELKTKIICRFCLGQGTDDLSNIYAKDIPVKSLLPLPMEVMSVASIEVFLNDGMPCWVCSKCRVTFDYCYRFKQMCKKAENLLSQVPLLGEWPAPLIKPIIPPELLPKIFTTYVENENLVQDESSPHSSEEQLQPQQQLQHISHTVIKKINNVKKTSTSVSTPRKILNSNPADLPEPPMPARLRKEINGETFNFLTKVENNEEISLDDVHRLIACEELEFSTDDMLLEDFTPTTPAVIVTSVSSATATANTTKTKPKVLNKSSIRILNKEADLYVEPRLKHPQLKQDEDGNVSIVTEILDPNEPYETEPDPIKNAEPVQTNVFPCPHCERTFPLLQLRDIHLVNHTRERHYPCPDCERSFFSKYDLQKHTVIHTGERKYKCSVCERGFTRPALLHRHEKIHTDIPKYLCIFCEKTFLSKDDMEKHTARHRKNRPFKCKICLKAFAFKQGLERHEVVHSSEQPFPCQYCDKSFCTSSKLARHLVAHAGKRPFPCKFCPKSYLLSHHLSRHMRTHKEGIIMYSCNECDEVYKTCNELVLHSVVHATETLTCPLCQNGFEDVETVTAHIKEHANNESFPCEFCDLIFLTYNEQNYHVKSAHPADLAAYDENEKNVEPEREKTKETELEEAIEEFLYDETTAEEYHITTTKEGEGNTNQQNIEENEQTNTKDEKELCEEQYLKVEKLTTEEVLEAEMFEQIIEDEQPVAKKSKIDNTTKVVKPAVTKDANSRRKSPRTTAETVVEQTSRKSPRGVNANRNTVNTGASKKNKAPAENKNDDGESGPSSSTNVSKTIQATVKTVSPTKVGGTATSMKVGEKKVRVQKIVVTKAEAAVMAKQGRLQIKDGNLIITSKNAK